METVEKEKNNLQTIIDFLDRNHDKGISFYKEVNRFDESVGAEWLEGVIPEKEILLVKDYDPVKDIPISSKKTIEENDRGNTIETNSQLIFQASKLSSLLKDDNERNNFLYNTEDGREFERQLDKIADMINKNEVREVPKQEVIQNFTQPHSEKQTNDLEVKVGQKFQLKENNSVLEVVRIDKNAHRDGSDELIMKPIGVNVGNQEFNWSQKALESGLKEGKIADVTNVQQLSEKQFTQLNYLKNQVKYLGMGESEKLHKDLENAILSPEKDVNVQVEYNNPDKLMKGNTISFNLHIGKGEQGGVFLNSYTANLTMKNGEERTQSFKVQKENNITTKEAINLLEGRAVKIEHDKVDKETGEISRTESFIKLKLKDEKTQYGNYKYEWYNKGYGVDVDDIMKKSNLVFADDTQRERTKKHLEKGNITEVSFVHDKKEIKGFAVLNPQYKQLNLYDNGMNRLNTNKPIQKPEVENNQKNEIVKEQHISRGH